MDHNSMLILLEEYRGDGNSLYCLLNFSVNLKLFLKIKSIKKFFFEVEC